NWLMCRCGSNAHAVPVRTHTTQTADATARHREPGGSFTGAQYPPPCARVTPKPLAADLQFSVGQIGNNPRRIAIVTACVRSFAPSLSTTFLMWKLTVFSEIVS